MISSILFTFLIPLFLLFTILWESKRIEDDSFFFSINYTTTLKGICAIVIILVHTPQKFQNPLQDAIGSFAYVAVTLFFLISAYGMQLSVERKENYLHNFWRNRLVSLLIPCFLINVVKFLYDSLFLKNVHVSSLWEINGYVKVLLEYCVLFYAVMFLKKKGLFKSYQIVYTLLIVGVVLSSLYLYLNNNDHIISAQLGWCYERLGLVWGLILYSSFPSLQKWFNNNNVLKSICFVLLSGLLGLLYLNFKTEWFWGEYLLKIVLGLSIIILLFLLSQKKVYYNRISEFLGNVSYEIYLSHGFMMGVVAYFFPNMNSGLFLIFTILLTILFSYFIHAIGKRLVLRLRK